MKLETIKIVHGVLKLRRFTPRRLTDTTSVKYATVASWLSRNKHRFEVSYAPSSGKAGRPQTYWVLKDAEGAELASEIDRVPFATADAALEPDLDLGASIRGNIAQAKEALALYRQSADLEFRRDAWDWFVSLEEIIQTRVAKMRQSGRDVSGVDAEELSWLRGHASSGFARTRVNVFHDVIKVANYFWKEVDSVPSLEGDPLQLEELVDVCSVSRAVGSLGVLAALGVSSRFSPTARTRHAMNATAHLIPPRVYCDGFEELFIEAMDTRPAGLAVPAVLAGAVSHRTILSEDRLVTLLHDVDFGMLIEPAVKSAYLRCRLELPRSNLNTIVDLAKRERPFSPGHTVYLSQPAPEEGLIALEFYRAFGEIAEEAIDFGNRIETTAPVITDADPFTKFRTMFVQALETPEEPRALAN